MFLPSPLPPSRRTKLRTQKRHRIARVFYAKKIITSLGQQKASPSDGTRGRIAFILPLEQGRTRIYVDDSIRFGN